MLRKSLVIVFSLTVLWQMIVWLTKTPPFILPAPMDVAVALITNADTILFHASVTIFEILIGLILGCLIGMITAWAILQSHAVRSWFLPLLVASQALPVFAIAPVLMLWLGFGMASKIAMATLIIYFPVTAALYDGLRSTDPGWIDMAKIMGASKHTTLKYIRLPSALPSFGSGLRIAAAISPIGAVVGEWVGSSSGLGFLMLHANARTQADLMFAALIILAFFAIFLYFTIDFLIKRAIFWQADHILEGT